MIYTYACRICPNRFETEQSMHDASLSICPLCEEEELYRELAAENPVHYRGSWSACGYATIPNKHKPTSRRGANF